MPTMLKRLQDAQNAHDAERMASLFADDYASSQPAHPSRTFVGRRQVLKNWTAFFEGVPDFATELVSLSIDGDTEWGELYWHGAYVDGSPFAERGVVILVVRDDLIAEGRLCMEPVESSGEGIDAAVRELAKPPPATAEP
jgi:ketosteroid isomerase-like protein